jgi:hypothetical protein
MNVDHIVGADEQVESRATIELARMFLQEPRAQQAEPQGQSRKGRVLIERGKRDGEIAAPQFRAVGGIERRDVDAVQTAASHQTPRAAPVGPRR